MKCELSKLNNEMSLIGLTGNRFGATRICHAEKVLDQHRVLIVVPVTHSNGEFGVIGEDLLLRVDNKGSTKAVNVMTLIRKGSEPRRNFIEAEVNLAYR